MRKISVVSLGVLLLLPVGCNEGAYRSDEQFANVTELEPQSQSVIIEAAELKAHNEVKRRANLSNQIDIYKQKLVNLVPGDDRTKAKLLQELKIIHDQAVASIPGVTPVAKEPARRRAGAIPLDRYEALKTKMKDYDMNNPIHVAAWSELKRKELGK